MAGKLISFLLIVVACLAVAIVLDELRIRRLIAIVEQVGGSVSVQTNWRGEPCAISFDNETPRAVSPSVLKEINQRHPRLEMLQIRNCTIDDSVILNISNMQNLQRLYLQECDIAATTLDPLNHLPMLESLGFHRSSFKNETAIDSLGGFSNVKGIDLRCTGICEHLIDTLQHQLGRVVVDFRCAEGG